MNNHLIRHCVPGDYAQIVDVYNYYIENSPATFDVTPYSVGSRAPWFAQFRESGPHQLLVAEIGGTVAGFCSCTAFKSRPAYDISVETSAYVAPTFVNQGIGGALYRTLFAQLENHSLHGAYAGITLPNDASVRLHQSLGFRQIGIFTEVGQKFGRFWDVAWFEKRLHQ